MKNSQSYLRHVDGLRALAVLSVIFYHFGLRRTPGGYVGVDVFFVISGFLITRLIYDELAATGRFDFARFYIRRMRRLLPALFVTLIATSIAGAVLLSPSAFEQFGYSLVAATLSISNILFWSQAGYFDTDSYLKPLLHTWSLSVEEQFYLVWPAFLWLLVMRCSLRNAAVAGALVAAGVLSFALNALWVNGGFDVENRYAIFFLTPFRVFEFAIGGLGIFLLDRVRDRIALQESLMIAGLAMIGYAIVKYDETIVFPYWNALLPSVGALFVILSGQARIIGQLLTNRASIFTGLISYSLYLVHWPLVVFYSYIFAGPPTKPHMLLLLAVTFVLAIVLYRYVETPFRKGAPSLSHSGPQKVFVTGGLAAMLFSCTLGLTIWAQSGWPWRQPQSFTAERVQAADRQRYAYTRYAGCYLQALDNPRLCKIDRQFQVLVFGNSHETDGYNTFAAAYGTNPAVNLISFGSTNNCKLEVVGDRIITKDKWYDCDKRFEMIADPDFVKRLGAVVFSANIPFGANKQLFWEILARMQRMNPNLAVVALGGYINTKIDCAELFNRNKSFDACKDPEFVSFAPFNEMNTVAVKIPSGLRFLYVDKAALLCSDGTLKSCLVKADDEPFTYDHSHLSFSFAKLVGRRMAQRYGAELHQLGFPTLSARNETE